MNQHLQTILNFIQQDESLTAEEKNALSKSLKDADKELEITAFKLDRTEKVKRTTAILLEETIEELEQKRKAVEVQNRELEIESSLERVRTVAMGMQQPDDLLGICEILFNELVKLGFSELRNTMINIHDDVRGSFLNYDFSAYAGKTITNIFYNSHPVVQSHVKQIKSSHDAFAEMIVTGKELEDWRKFRKENGEQDDPKLGDIKALYYYFYSVVKGDIGISNFEPVSEKQLAVLKRFSNVFDLAYKRYTDITKAEAQAREAQIENALEKVRSRTMAMQRSEELPEAANNLFLQVQALGIPAWSAGYCIWDEDLPTGQAGKQGITFWMSSEGVMQPPAHAPLTEDPSFIHMREAYERGDAFHVEEVGGEALVTHYQYMRMLPVVGEILDSIIAAGHPLPTFQIFHCVYFSQGFLLFITYEAVPKAHDIFKRFGNVFEQTYTRFLDLKKAEAQAREATIEAALEKIRSRSLAMHRSEELKDVIAIVFEKLNDLKVLLGTVGIQLFDQKSMDSFFWVGNTIQDPQMVCMPYNKKMMLEDTYYKDGWHAMAQGLDIINKEYTHQQKNMHFEYLFANNDFTQIPETAREVIRQIKSHIICLMTEKNSALFADSWNGQIYSKENLDVLKRASRVFEQAYIRFLDLQKAETQSREAQIELALERVRSRSMAMHKSDEVLDVADTLYESLKHLDFPFGACTIMIMDKASGDMEHWVAGFNHKTYPQSYQVKYFNHPFYEAQLSSWKNGEKFMVLELAGDLKRSYDEVMFTDTGYKNFPEEEKKWMQQGQAVNFSLAYMAHGALMWGPGKLTDGYALVLQRFAKVFEQTYTRFLDLQKAEAQAREAQIEAALEKVRSRSLAMHNSSELREVVKTAFEKLQDLNFSLNDGAVSILIFKEGSKDHIQWIADPGQTYATSFEIAYTDHPLCTDIIRARESGLDYFSKIYSVEEKNDYFKYLFEHSEYKRLPDEVKKMILGSEHYGISIALTKNSAIVIPTNSGRLLSENEKEILKRFAKVFEQSYTRFLDLQKAEAQAREATIEAALERVRSRSLAMHHSDELEQVVVSLFDRLVELGLSFDGACIFIFEKEKRNIWLWIATKHLSAPVKIDLPYDEDIKNNIIIKDLWNAIETSEHIFNRSYSGETKNDYFRYVAKHNESKIPESVRNIQIEADSWTVHLVAEKNSMLGYDSWSGHSITGEDFQILIKFAKVFEQAYIRFLDLQKAEAQTREAQIQLALERVRARTMAMQRSDELLDAATILFQQVKALGVPQWTCGFNIWEIGDKEYTFYPANPDGHVLAPCKVPLTEHWVFSKMDESRKRGEEFYMYEKEGEEQEEHYRYMHSVPGGLGDLLQNMLNAGMQIPTFQIDHFANFSHGNLMFITYEHFPQMHDIFKRFAKVFEQTYTRFLDLKKAEAQGLEAIKRASVDRVRAEIASMRTTNDLERITPLIWNELTTLGVTFIRCGVFIMDEVNEQIKTLLSTSDGKAIASFQLPFDNPEPLTQLLPHWRRKEVYKDHWDEAAFIESTRILLQRGAIASPEIYTTEHQPTELYLHFLPFLQGMLYVGNETPLKEDELQLVQNLADAFSIAYARYEDFNKLELAKEQIEKTLVDLKQAQAQLVQSAKMASLGELTAGIAHEIQNPLNFVNNFSEVNTELIDELKEEITKGNMEEVIAIANDIKENELKINHHGKRADAIVKGMLQHSRTSTDTKEPTNINALADEYLRLAYHGLRGKDNTFNVTMKTDFDETIGNINIIPQDIGRVLLNLYNNAFYAVNEKQKTESKKHKAYEPIVSVSTKKINAHIEISVSDNGHGIPQKIVDKIFQPFFTTKPTGQGTGLGLSLSYDIVKAHGGEINVETKEGVSTEFKITLPV